MINKITITLHEDGTVTSSDLDVDKRIINYLKTQLETWNPTVSGKWVSPNIFQCDQVWTEDDVKLHPDFIFVFGDNDERKGETGQAIIRYLKNVLSIRTKKALGFEEKDYYTDDEYEENIRKLDADFAAIEKQLQMVQKSSSAQTVMAMVCPECRPNVPVLINIWKRNWQN